MKTAKKSILVTLIPVMAILGAAMSSSCTTLSPPVSKVQSTTAATRPVNYAVMVSAASLTPTYGPSFTQNLNILSGMLANPNGNWQFKVSSDQEGSKASMIQTVTSAAQSVGDDGTLLLFIAAHGAPSGLIESDKGAAFADFAYDDILTAIRQGRQGRSFRRLVLVVPACFNSSWLQTLGSSQGLIKQRLVIFSVDGISESKMSDATNLVVSVLQTYDKAPGTPLREFVETVKEQQPLVQFAAVPETMLDEPLN